MLNDSDFEWEDDDDDEWTQANPRIGDNDFELQCTENFLPASPPSELQLDCWLPTDR